MQRYEDRFIEIINYIEANLDRDFDINKLSQLAYLSKYHFHRQCSAFFGMPVMSLVKILRLKRAAYQLAYRDDSNVLEIALTNGYESHEAFSRAFKKLFNKSPSDFRRAPDWTPWHSQYQPILNLRTKIMHDKANFNVEIVEFPKTLIATMEHRGNPSLLGKTIKKFIAWRKENRLPPSKSKTYNLVYEDPNVTAAESYRFDLCCAVDIPINDKENGIVNKVIPAGKCVVIRHIGSDDSINVAVNYLYSKWLTDSTFKIRNFPLFFERISFFPDVAESKMVTDIYLPIE